MIREYLAMRLPGESQDDFLRFILPAEERRPRGPTAAKTKALLSLNERMKATIQRQRERAGEV